MDDAAQNNNQLQVTGDKPQVLTGHTSAVSNSQQTVSDPTALLRQILGESQQPTQTQQPSVQPAQPIDDELKLEQQQIQSDQQQTPAAPQISTPQKEALLTSDGGQGEKIPLVELKEDETIPEDVQGWVEKIQKEDIKLPEPIQDHGVVVMAEPSVKFVDDKIVLPMTQQSYQQGLKKKVTESARWLTEWCKRVVLMLGDQVKFRGE